MDKYLSIITNFGCHYQCPYCIVKNNNLHIPKTTVDGLDNLAYEIKKNNCNWVSLSGGGDPLYKWLDHFDWYYRLCGILPEDIKTELHTSYINANEGDIEFPFGMFDRVVYHVRTTDLNELIKIERHKNEIVRIVMIVTEELKTEDFIKLSRFVEMSNDIDELSFRQLVDSNYETQYYNHDLLMWGHKHELWHYIEQNDYNLYYAENKVSYRYEDFKNETV